MMSHENFSLDLPVVMFFNESMWQEEVSFDWGSRDRVLELIQLILDKLLRADGKFDPAELIHRRLLELDHWGNEEE